PVGRAAQEFELGLDALDEGVRPLHPDAAARGRVDLDVDHGRARAGGGIDQVADLGVHHGAVAGPFDGVAAGAGIDGAGAARGMQDVVAQAAGHHVAGAAAADRVVAGAALEEVAAGAAIDAVGAIAAVDHVDAAAALDGIVAAAAGDVVAAAAGQGRAVVAGACIDAVVAAAGDVDLVIAGAGVGHDVHGDVGRDLDHVVAAAGAQGQLLALGRLHGEGFAVDAHVQGAVVALADPDAVAGAAGGDHQLVGAHVGLAAAGIAQGALARDLHVAVSVQRIDLDGLAVRGLAQAAVGRIAPAAVDLGRAGTRQQRHQRGALDLAGIDRIQVQVR